VRESKRAQGDGFLSTTPILCLLLRQNPLHRLCVQNQNNWRRSEQGSKVNAVRAPFEDAEATLSFIYALVDEVGFFLRQVTQ
jgi:hypothetical protein